jgi:CRP/FNR family transcriptional regulator, cyclic AMP receptor protein
MIPVPSKTGLAPVRADKAPMPILDGNDGSLANVAPNQIIFEQGAPTDTLFYIHTGRVKLAVQSESGRAALISLLGPGDFFGFGCLVGKEQRLSTVTAIAPCIIETIKASAAMAALDHDRKFSKILASAILRRNVRLQEDLVDQHFHPTEKRLARLLLRLAENESQQTGVTAAMINQSDLAEMIGTTRSRVNFFMNRFRRSGFIDYNGKLTVRRSLSQVLRPK